MNVLLTISYDGTNYCGWQRQNNMPSIQEEIEKALTSVFKREVCVQGASRTDSGVHAKGQRAVFTLEPYDFKIPVEKLSYVINNCLPPDIRILCAGEVPHNFHPVRDAIKKTYEYKICNAPIKDPLSRLYSEHIYLPLNFQSMQSALPYFIGEHDFKAFCASGGYAKTSTRTVFSIELSKDENMIALQITGNGFLYNMVRIIAGTLIDVGLGRIEAESVRDILESLDRAKAGKTASARGLVLLKIYYKNLF